MIARLAALALTGFALLASPPAAAQRDAAPHASPEDDIMPYAPRAGAPPGYPADYVTIVRAGEDEGQLVIYGATDADVVAPLLSDFRALYPRIKVTYEDLNTTVLYHRFVAETRLRDQTADILWSSAMDQMVSLVSEGYAMTYASPEKPNLPDWASWKDQSFATTYEPVVLVYNKDLVKESEAPQTRADLVRLLASDPARFKNKIVTYDIEKSGIGFLLATQDEAASPGFQALAEALGRADTKLALTTAAMADQVSTGKALIGYNLLGGYALSQARRKPSLAYVLPRDYTLIISRVMIANKNAAHPNAARLWIDYLLSKRGQSVLADQTRLFAVRSDVEGENTAASLRQQLGAVQRPIIMSPALTGSLDNSKYRDFILKWRAAMKL